jgi:hypothetical protein
VSAVSASKFAKPPSMEGTMVGFFANTARASATVREVSLLESWAGAREARAASVKAGRNGRMAVDFISG